MDFYTRYEALCRRAGIDPCSQKTAETLGATRANISYWKKGTKPSVDRVRAAADMLHTTTDYLLGRTDNPADTTAAEMESVDVGSVPKSLIDILNRLDPVDMGRVMGYVEHILMEDKYQESVGTDARVI